MPEFSPSASDAPILLFPKHISLWADGGELPALAMPVPGPIRVLRYGWLALALGLLGAVALGQQGLALILGVSMVMIPLLVLGVRRRLFPPARPKAWFDSRGLHLACGTETAPGGVYRHFIAFGDITRIASLDQSIDLPRRGHAQYRTYLVETRQFLGDNTCVHISTQQSLEALHSVLERLRQLPAAAHISLPPTHQYGA